MTNKEILQQVNETGLYRCLVKQGIIPLKVNYYLEMYQLYQTKMVINNNQKLQAITDVSDAFKCCERSVWNAIYFMEK